MGKVIIKIIRINIDNNYGRIIAKLPYNSLKLVKLMNLAGMGYATFKNWLCNERLKYGSKFLSNGA